MEESNSAPDMADLASQGSTGGGIRKCRTIAEHSHTLFFRLIYVVHDWVVKDQVVGIAEEPLWTSIDSIELL